MISIYGALPFSSNEGEGEWREIKSSLIDLQWFASAEEEGRTEQPSEHKLRKAREEGRVAKAWRWAPRLSCLQPLP